MYYLSKMLKKLRMSSIKNCSIEKKVKICSGCMVVNSSIADYSYIGYDTEIVNANVGKYCSIASNCMIGGGEHPLNFVSTSPVFHVGKNIFNMNFAQHEFEPYKQTYIGNDVWIAHNVKIKGGINIATGAVIGMGSVVTHDVGPYEIWAGNPAKLVRKRFDDDMIQKLLMSKWWEFKHEEVKKYAQVFDDPEKFLEMLDSSKNNF